MADTLPKSMQEQGTSLSGYEERGPYHCKDCIHKVHQTTPICIHPVVVKDPSLKANWCWTDTGPDGRGVFIDLENGCCKYVKQEEKDARANT